MEQKRKAEQYRRVRFTSTSPTGSQRLRPSIANLETHPEDPDMQAFQVDLMLECDASDCTWRRTRVAVGRSMDEALTRAEARIRRALDLHAPEIEVGEFVVSAIDPPLGLRAQRRLVARLMTRPGKCGDTLAVGP